MCKKESDEETKNAKHSECLDIFFNICISLKCIIKIAKIPSKICKIQ